MVRAVSRGVPRCAGESAHQAILSAILVRLWAGTYSRERQSSRHLGTSTLVLLDSDDPYDSVANKNNDVAAAAGTKAKIFLQRCGLDDAWADCGTSSDLVRGKEAEKHGVGSEWES